MIVLLLPKGQPPGGYRFRDLYSRMGHDVMVSKAAKSQVDEDASHGRPQCGSHPPLRAHLEADFDFSVASQTTQVPVIFGIHGTKRRTSPNEKFTPQGPGRSHGGWAAALEAALCHPHTGAAIRNGGCRVPAQHQPLGEPSATSTRCGVQEREHADIRHPWHYSFT